MIQWNARAALPQLVFVFRSIGSTHLSNLREPQWIGGNKRIDTEDCPYVP